MNTGLHFVDGEHAERKRSNPCEITDEERVKLIRDVANEIRYSKRSPVLVLY